MAENLPTVSVIIPARAAGATLPRTLQSVGAQTYPKVVEVIVAAADESSAEAALGATVIVNPKGLTPAGLNQAIEASSGEVIVRCDAQSLLPPDYVERAVETLIRTGAANVGGMQVPVGTTPWERAIAEAMKSPLGSGDARYRIGGEAGPVETVYLGVFRREALQRIGGFDEDFARTQDYELNHRLIEAGEIVWFDPQLRVTYQPRGSLPSLARQYFDYGRAKRQFNRKHPGSLRWRQMAAPALVTILTISVVGSVWAPALLVVPAAYATTLLAAGAAGSGTLWRVALAIATMHVSWGSGFISQRGRGR
ncbi:MAG TPA: glycosyltransferase family 2 protein [Acidimicrobiia bacterium]|nr:glycosyltransferase family 2 protein [Acidimicrobiia bacterium]